MIAYIVVVTVYCFAIVFINIGRIVETSDEKKVSGRVLALMPQLIAIVAGIFLLIRGVVQ